MAGDSAPFVDHRIDLSDEARHALAAAGLPSDVPLERQRGGIANHVYRAGDYIVRLGTGSDARHFAQTAAILGAVHGHVACPELVHADLASKYPMLICRYVPGDPLRTRWHTMNLEQKAQLIDAICEAITPLHEYDWRAIPCFADLAPWPERERDRMHRATEAARQDPALDQTFVDKLEHFFLEHESCLDDAGSAVLIHNDINPGNVIICNNEVAAFIDFDDAEVAPREIEFWSLIDEFLADDSTTFETLKAMLASHYEFRDPGALERRKVTECVHMMAALTANFSYRTREQAIERARKEYQEYIALDGYRAWFR